MLVPVIAAMVYEVVARKLFIAPTDWAYDTSRMLSGAMFMLGAGYALDARCPYPGRFFVPQLETADSSAGRFNAVLGVLHAGDAFLFLDYI